MDVHNLRRVGNAALTRPDADCFAFSNALMHGSFPF